MTTFKTIMAVSALTLLGPIPGFAADLSASATSGSPVLPSSRPASPNGQTVLSKAANNIQVFFTDPNKSDALDPILIRRDWTAHGLIGEIIMNQNNEKIASVNDIIIDKSGRPILVIVSDKGFLGIGNKLAAFDYQKVTKQDKNGNVTMALTQDMIDHAADFSYDRRDWAKAKIIPSGSMSTNMLLSGSLYDDQGTNVAYIENIHFRSGEVSQVIVGFNQTLGMGGDLAALDFKDLKVLKKDDRIDLSLSPKQTANFKVFEKSVSN